MPRFDLRQDDGTLDALAPFKVLTAMCHPNDRLQREKMLGTIQKETGEGKPRRHPQTPEEFIHEVRRVDTRAAVAGSLLLAMIQLHSNGYRASLNQAIPLIAALLPEWVQPVGRDWSRDRRASPPTFGAAVMTDGTEYFRAADIAQLTGMSLRTVRRWIADEIIPSTKLGGARLTHPSPS
jgi:hypothetical protein